VVGADFSEYHKLFQKIYEDVYESIDPIAENLRKLGSKAPFTLVDFLATRTIDDASSISQDPRALASDLLTANDVLLDEISDAFDCATNYGRQGVANFLAGRMDQHQLWKWQLSASLGLEVAVANPDPVDAQGIDEDDLQDESADTYALTPMPIMGRSATEDGNISSEDELADRAAAARLGEGSFVSWNTSNGRARGKIEKVMTKGQAKSSDGYVLETTPDQPAYSIRIYKEQGNGYIPTDVVVVHRGDYLTITSALPAPRSEDLSMVEERKTMIAGAERITMTAEVRSVATDDGSIKVAGYAATFNNEATGLNFREVIAPGAFTRTLQTDNPIFLLINHDMEQLPLASTRSGTLQLSEDEIGLRMEATLDPLNPRAAELASALGRGDVDKMSFAFTVAPGGDTRAEGLRTLTDLDLYEISVVNLPAYDDTSVGLRNEQATEDLNLRKRKLALKFKQYSLTK
jgi:HK97 family phage prohead protease